MARYGILSDIHGNLPALEAALEALDALGVDELLCLGDVVGYGPFPAECTDLVTERCSVIVQGNHEEAVLDPRVARTFNGAARAAAAWTRFALDDDRTRRIASWPLMTETGPNRRILCVHDSPAPGPSAYIHDAGVAEVAFRGFEGPLCLHGHTHLPTVFRIARDGVAGPDGGRGIHGGALAAGEGVHLDAGWRWLCNPGSIGQPRDADPRASFGLLDCEAGTFTVHRAAYDVARVQAATIEAGLPEVLSTRLAVGA